MPANLRDLQFHETRLEEKIAKLKSGELNAEQNKGDGRQEEALHRAEKQLRQVKTEISQASSEVKKGDK